MFAANDLSFCLDGRQVVHSYEVNFGRFVRMCVFVWFCSGLMDHQLKRNQDERLNACKKIMSYVNSADFSTLNDKEIRAFLMIREISCGVIIGQRKLVSELAMRNY